MFRQKISSQYECLIELHIVDLGLWICQFLKKLFIFRPDSAVRPSSVTVNLRGRYHTNMLPIDCPNAKGTVQVDYLLQNEYINLQFILTHKLMYDI